MLPSQSTDMEELKNQLTLIRLKLSQIYDGSSEDLELLENLELTFDLLERYQDNAAKIKHLKSLVESQNGKKSHLKSVFVTFMHSEFQREFRNQFPSSKIAAKIKTANKIGEVD